ncbi:DUF952 domain-containing protein [Yinghuangia seranimata]|uniref:DUF952 domain-containing protein n=1 Tax=Yinghuangia seranimata TaxID=408067 RepID=UPI00248B49BC|nr:DUF952 domain-containing protein [Yinghuangia seranimata]MDI2127221.1 DUF952 domain-containing protein [Yinghuangia seranimata]
MDPAPIYKLLPTREWESAESTGLFTGSAVDRRDGFIHFSTAAQLEETARRHFAGRTGLTLLAVGTGDLDALKWEPSRGGDLFPHLYGDLATTAVAWAAELSDELLTSDAEDPGEACARAVAAALREADGH